MTKGNEMSPLTKISYDYIKQQQKTHLYPEELMLYVFPKIYNLLTKEGRKNTKYDYKHHNKVFKMYLWKLVIKHTIFNQK